MSDDFAVSCPLCVGTGVWRGQAVRCGLCLGRGLVDAHKQSEQGRTVLEIQRIEAERDDLKARLAEAEARGC